MAVRPEGSKSAGGFRKSEGGEGMGFRRLNGTGLCWEEQA